MEHRTPAKLVDLTTEALRIAKEEERLIQAKVNQGDLAPIEAVRVKAATLSAQVALVDAENAYNRRKESLLVLLGEQPNQDILLQSHTPDMGSFNIDVDTARYRDRQGVEQQPHHPTTEVGIQIAEDNLRKMPNMPSFQN